MAVLLEGQEHGDSLPQLAWLGSGLRASEYPESLFLRIEHNLLDKQNGRERKRSNAQPHLPICLRKLVPGQPTSSGRHTSFRACETTFLPPQRESRWLGQVITLLDRSSGHLIFYNLHENQLNVLKATCFFSEIFKWCSSHFGCSKSLEWGK